MKVSDTRAIGAFVADSSGSRQFAARASVTSMLIEALSDFVGEAQHAPAVSLPEVAPLAADEEVVEGAVGG